MTSNNLAVGLSRGASSTLAEQLADPDIYDDHQKVRELADAHEAAETQVGDLLAQWEDAQSRLEKLLAGR